VLDAVIGVDATTSEDVLLHYEDRPKALDRCKPGTGKSPSSSHLDLTDLQNRTPGVVIDPTVHLLPDHDLAGP